MHTTRYHVIVLVWALLATALTVFAQSTSLPYNPTTILLPQDSSNIKNIAYAFVPIPQSDSKHQLVSLNISASLSLSNLSFNNISPNLPFTSDDTTAFIPSISSADEISVYTGSCSASRSSQLWRFTPSHGSATGNGTWVEHSVTTGTGAAPASLTGAKFLSNGFTFSTLVHANASQSAVYNFGGMCPTSGATVSTWQSSANYSHSMLRLSPSQSASSTSYSLDLPVNRGPPVAEAGFSITGLSPTYSNNPGVMTQQMSYVLLGGHTESAFINMSQVALWSLPEESWSFVTVDSPSTNGKSNTELTVKSTQTSVDSRSGHTAVLSEDGTKIIVYGGWVGGTSQAADPQLVVLSVGTGFGGTGNWKWTIPDVQPTGSGIYGHGAVMLPGNVMMVLGGYNISVSTTRKRAMPAVGASFFNATSLEWVSSYTNPSSLASPRSDASKSGSSSITKRLGLGLGLGLGLAALIAAIAIYCCYRQRLKRRRHEDREKDLNALSQCTTIYPSPNRGMGQRGGSFPWSGGRWNGTNDHDQILYDSTSAVAGYENLHNGVHNLRDGDNIPKPPRQIPRKPLHSRTRGTYQLAQNFDFNSSGNHGRTNSLGTAGPIHPIYEADEEDHPSRRQSADAAEGVGVALGDPSIGLAEMTNQYSDPFRDPNGTPTIIMRRNTNRSVSTSELESPARSREREIQEWVTDWAAADVLMNAQTRTHSSAGRLSPTRRAQLVVGSHSVSSISGEEDNGRTASNLSERSVAVSSVSRSGSSSQGRSRSNSLRGFISTAMNPFSTAAASSSMSPAIDGSSAFVRPPRSAGSGSTFNTARTSFPTLQAEGESLLPRPDHDEGYDYSPTHTPHAELGSPSKNKASSGQPGRGQTGWLGSLRRAIGAESQIPSGPRMSSREASPVRDQQGSGSQPRRTVSAGATLWRRKQGRGDWEDSADDLNLRGGGTSTRSNTFTGEFNLRDSLMGEDDEGWDIERAVENRVVQVMFTVPKEKLRVINGAAEEDKSEVGSLRSKAGSGKSEKNLAILPPTLIEFDERQDTRPRQTIGEKSSTSPSPKGKGRVGEIVENIERRNTPEHR
ncbi:hypothetical protein BJ875DRAFT_389192 [Amylocarpus encephaloides]|uniref:Galactose oxidase n=1 Tax=Amylocarpus encephaloides TaxID=45428 RepID=A0A9P8BZF0_9HELO|nr:hypothetical protein BJ875DRAFT_389192 [Amylocarpus encephaloides]